MPTKDLMQLIEITRQRLYLLDEAELAKLAAHEYDEDAVVPAQHSAGAGFLRSVASVFSTWIGREGRFPTDDELDTDAVTAEVCWHLDQLPSVVAQTYVDLGLYFSGHAEYARGARIEDFRQVLERVASQLIFTLAKEYGPMV